MDLNPSAAAYSDGSSSFIEPDPPELPPEERLKQAMKAHKNQEKPISIRKIARMYGVPRSSLQDRIKGKTLAKEVHERRQRLNPQEEAALIDWILRLQAWGWPARVDQVRANCGNSNIHSTRPYGLE